MYNPQTGVVTATPTVINVSDKRTINNLSGRAGVQYQPTDNHNFYGSFARGYKGPAANNNQSLAVSADATPRPETATAYEVGFKLRLLDKRLALNVAAYHQTIKNHQVSSVDPFASSISTQHRSAGKTRSHTIA